MPETPAPPSTTARFNDDTKFREGLIHQQQNRPQQAEQIYKEILAANPGHSNALCMIGLLVHKDGRLDEALAYLTRSVDANPEFANAHLHRGEVFLSMGQTEQALACFNQALAVRPDFLDASVYKSKALQNLGRLDEALASDQKALAQHPGAPKIRLNIAYTLKLMGRHKDSLFQLDITISDNPDFAEAYLHKGALLNEMGRIAEALAVFDAGIAVNDQIAKLHVGRGVVLIHLEQLEEALRCYKRALELAPNEAETHSNAGALYQRMGRGQEAIACLRRAIALKPDFAEAHQNLAFSLLSVNQNEEALEEYEWRWQMPGRTYVMRHYGKPLWDGKADLADKTLMLWTEQGPQDVTIWASCLPQIIARTKHCIVNTYPKLVPLYKRSFPDAEIRPDRADYDASQNDFDYHLPMGNLFKITRPDLEPEQKQDAYLIADPERITYWRRRLAETGPAPYVGISWKGALITDGRSPNYTNVADWAPLIHKRATFVNLQVGESASELGEFEKQHGVRVHDFDDLDLFDDLDDVAAFSAALDVAISVSTCVSALTAGVGTSTWLLSWKQSPWNNFLLRSRGPDITYYERNSGEDWQACFTAMADRLQALIDG